MKIHFQKEQLTRSSNVANHEMSFLKKKKKKEVFLKKGNKNFGALARNYFGALVSALRLSLDILDNNFEILYNTGHNKFKVQNLRTFSIGTFYLAFTKPLKIKLK